MNLQIMTILLILVFGTIFIVILLLVYRNVSISQTVLRNYSHLRYFRDREKFNEIGVEIVNGAVSGDTLYLIMRSGTFEEKFAKVVGKFRGHDNTRLIVITPETSVFLENFDGEFKKWISELYENPFCNEVRGMLLEPANTPGIKDRMRGYLFISDGHVHSDDDGFYTNTNHSAEFLHGYFKSLISSSKQIKL